MNEFIDEKFLEYLVKRKKLFPQELLEQYQLEFKKIQQKAFLYGEAHPEKGNIKETNSEEENVGIFEELEQFSKQSGFSTTNALNNPQQENAKEKGDNGTKLNETIVISKTLAKIEDPPTYTEDQNRYQVLEVLGEGGMGTVELVHDNLLAREVALKRVKSEQQNNHILTKKKQALLWRLQREASIMAILEHPNIVPLYDMQQSKATEKSTSEICFTMRKVEGKTLKELLNEKKDRLSDFSENKILSIFLKICDAVSYAHSKGIIHRDLKPDNIMLGEFGEVYVMDWGIAKQLEVEDPSEEVIRNFVQQEEMMTIGGMGTPGYMSPEQMRAANEVVPQSDVFSLGKILKECFTLFSPIEEMNRNMKFFSNRKESLTANTKYRTKKRQVV